MKVKTNELTGKWLDYAVAIARNLPLSCDAIQPNHIAVGIGNGDLEIFSPSSNWANVQHLLELRGMSIIVPLNSLLDIQAIFEYSKGSKVEAFGETAAVAICRAVVLAYIGDEVDLPIDEDA